MMDIEGVEKYGWRAVMANISTDHNHPSIHNRPLGRQLCFPITPLKAIVRQGF